MASGTFLLQPFPNRAFPTGFTITGSIRLTASRLEMEYLLKGAMSELRIPAPEAAPLRTDGLWQHTCMELFLRVSGTTRYTEFNFSPSGAWACYGFESYRVRTSAMPALQAPRIETRIQDGLLALNAVLELPRELSNAARETGLDAGITAVIETRAGELSYWALDHASPQPDFHKAESFRLHLEKLEKGEGHASRN